MIAEGTVRWRFSPEKFQKLTEGLDDTPLVDEEDRIRYQQIVDEEIRTGQLEPSQREKRLQDIEQSETLERREFYWHEAEAEARIQIKVPGEEDVIKVLLNPDTTPEQIRDICKDAFMTRIFEGREVKVSAWPLRAVSALPSYLSEHCEQFIAALRDSRFPRCDVAIRPSTRLKQFWFLSRALSGAAFGVSTRTAINLVGSLRPEETAQMSRYAKPERKRVRRKYKSRSRT